MNRHVYRDTGSPGCDQEIYVELQYATIIKAVRQGHLRQVSADIARRNRGKWSKAANDEQIRYNFTKIARLRQLANAERLRQAGTSQQTTDDTMKCESSEFEYFESSAEYRLPSDFYESDSDSAPCSADS